MQRTVGCIINGFLLMTFLLAPMNLLAESVSPGEPDGSDAQVSGEVEIGGRVFLHGPPEKDRGKLEEYRDIPSGLFLEKLHLRLDRDIYLLDFWAREAGEKDQQFLLTGTKLGQYSLEFEWNQIPHTFSNTGRSIYRETSSGVFELPDLLQTEMEGAAAADRSEILRSFLSTSPDIELRTRWDIARFLYRSMLYPSLEMQIEYTLTRKEGERPIGTTFAFTNQVELPEPVDQTVHDLRLGADLVRESWQLQFGYNLSVFRNEVDVLIWDNPLRAADAAGGSSRGRLDLPPDNIAQTVNLAGAMNLPGRSRLSGLLSYSWRSQDDHFIPHTINSAISDPGLVLPADSLDGNVQVRVASLRYVSRPLENVSTKISYRLYNLVNKTPEYTFPAQVLADSSLLAEPVTTSSFDYTKQNAHADAGWRLRESVSLGIGYDVERWDRNAVHREAPQSDEQTPKVTLDYLPSEGVLLRAAYSRSWRRIDDYNPFSHLSHTVNDEVGPDSTQGQHVLLRKFDEADRDRHRLDFLAQLSPTDTMTISPTLSLRNDNYSDSTFGLQDDKSWVAGFDSVWAPVERVAFLLGFIREEVTARQSSRYREPPSQLENPTYDWTSTTKDTINTVSASADMTLIPKKLDLRLGWNYSRAAGKIRSSNPTTPAGGTDAQNASATAVSFPSITESLQQLEVSLRYYIEQALRLKFRYALESFKISDFRIEDVAPFMGAVEAGSGTSIYLGAKIRDYTAHILALTLDYEF